jgi:hypothetical protein
MLREIAKAEKKLKNYQTDLADAKRDRTQPLLPTSENSGSQSQRAIRPLIASPAARHPRAKGYLSRKYLNICFLATTK